MKDVKKIISGLQERVTELDSIIKKIEYDGVSACGKTLNKGTQSVQKNEKKRTKRELKLIIELLNNVKPNWEMSKDAEDALDAMVFTKARASKLEIKEGDGILLKIQEWSKMRLDAGLLDTDAYAKVIKIAEEQGFLPDISKGIFTEVK